MNLSVNHLLNSKYDKMKSECSLSGYGVLYCSSTMTWLHLQHYPDGCRQLTDPTLGPITLHISSATSASSLKDQEFSIFSWQLCPVIPVIPLRYPFMCLEKSTRDIKKLQHQVSSSALQHWSSVTKLHKQFVSIC